jgi:hypothetical protein
MKSEWGFFAAAAVRLNYFDLKPNLILTAVGQVFTNQNPPMPLSYWRTTLWA